MISATVSILTLPDQFAPVNTDGLWFQLYSDSYTETNFSYIADVFSWNLSDSVQSLGRYKLPPRPDTGAGVFTSHKILKSQMDTNPSVAVNTTCAPTPTYNSFLKYFIDYGYQLDPGLTFSNTFKITFNYGGVTASYLGLSFSTSPGLIVGDEITLSMVNQKENVGYNGPAIVASASSLNVITNILYGATPSSAERGSITDLIRINGTTDESVFSATGGNYTWIGTKQYAEKWLNIGDYYVLDSNIKSSLSTYTFSSATYSGSGYNTGIKPEFTKSLYVDQYDTESVIMNPNGPSSSQYNGSIYYYGYNQYNSLVESFFTGTFTFSYKGKYELGVGPQNIKDLFFTATFNNVAWYNIIIMAENGQALKTITRSIDNTCSVFERVQLRFLNLVGGYDTWNFIRNSTKTITTQRVEWKKQLAWNYQVGDRQDSVLSQKAESSYMINTDWLNQYDYTYLSQLITSPGQVYRVDGTYSIPIMITDTNWVQKKLITDQVFNLTINYKDGFNLMTQDN